MTEEEFKSIKEAIEIIQNNPKINRIDGNKWSVYLVGQIVRIDIKK